MINLMYVATALIICLGIFLIYLIFRERRKVREQQQEIASIYEELARAVELLDSPTESEVIVGLQILSTMNAPAIRLKALPKVTELTHDNNPRIAEQAQLAIEKLSLSRREA
ncbi:MAG TPA: hypothetical protein VN256_11345 [Pyrinomonadaceae bacterium]|nr:hypothetical protein [Pyrinomonadaceae bacterium]